MWIYGYLVMTYGEKKIMNIFYSDGDFYENLENITGKTLEVVEKDWKEYIKKLF